jgi:two-component system chemotaxis family response regulator WspR
MHANGRGAGGVQKFSVPTENNGSLISLLKCRPDEDACINAIDKSNPPSCRVLLVDDQAIVAEAIRRMLMDQPDISLFTCADAALAIPTAREVKPTVILQDLVMPGADGFTLVRFFKADPATSPIPIIVLSSKEDPRDKSRAFETGAGDYLVKLPDRIELMARIRAHSRSYLAQTERDEAYRALELLKLELEKKNHELARLSVLDGLTGIANRRRFDEALLQECRRAKREEDTLSLILTDVDFFKKYNDSYGHLAGDECLKQVATAVASAARRPGDLGARYGGEEFALILPSTDSEGAAAVAEKLRLSVLALAIPHQSSTVAATVSLSLGVVTESTDEGLEPKLLIDRADHALYEAKRNGRNAFAIAPSPAPKA